MKRRPSGTRQLISYYKSRRRAIQARLMDFRRLYKRSDRDIFGELCFCILTPQSKALSCHEAIEELKRSGALFCGSEAKIRRALKGRARFHNKKASFLVGARKIFTRGRRLDIKRKLALDDIFATRDWLVENIKGIGYKEASHFLRNIGLGRDLAILDRHILKNLKLFGVVTRIPASVAGRAAYLDIERKTREFARSIDISPEELDLLLWSMETGFIFK